MANDAKFIQIAAVQIGGNQHLLYALDESGRVWMYDHRHGWQPLSEQRGKGMTS